MIDTRTPQVALVRMPWDAVHRPSPAYGLILSILRDAEIEARVLNAHMWLSDELSPNSYQVVADNSSWTLLPEFTFSKAAFPEHFNAPTSEVIAEFPATQRQLIESALGEETFELIERVREVEAQRLCQRIAEACDGIKVVGMSCTINQLVPALAAARAIKERNRETRVLLGGAQIEGEMGDEVLRLSPYVDAVYKGEAEVGVVDTVRFLLGERKSPPMEYVSHRLPGGEIHAAPRSAMLMDLDALPRPTYDEYFQEVDARAGTEREVKCRHIPYVSSRGCWWGEKQHCTFCGLNGESMGYRSRSAESVMEELSWLAERHSKLVFIGMDNIIPHGYLKTLLPMLRDSPLDLRLFCETKSNLKRRDVELYAQAGLSLVQPGIESLSDNTLRVMRKGVSAIQNIYLLKLGAQYGVSLQWNVLCGFPGETVEDYSSQIELFPHLWHFMAPAGCSWFGVQRFSPFHFESEKLGIQNVRALTSYRYLFPEEIADLDRIAFYFAFDYAPGYDIDDQLKLDLRKAAREWGMRSSMPGPAATLSYLRGPNFVEISDTRDPKDVRVHRLTGVEAKVFLACDDLVSLSKLVELVGDEARTHKAIADLVACGLVHSDGKRVLGLALPGSSKSGPSKRVTARAVVDDAKGSRASNVRESVDRGADHDRLTLESVQEGHQFF